jgi:hypothetical protein
MLGSWIRVLVGQEQTTSCRASSAPRAESDPSAFRVCGASTFPLGATENRSARQPSRRFRTVAHAPFGTRKRKVARNAIRASTRPRHGSALHERRNPGPTVGIRCRPGAVAVADVGRRLAVVVMLGGAFRIVMRRGASSQPRQTTRGSINLLLALAAADRLPGIVVLELDVLAAAGFQHL